MPRRHSWRVVALVTAVTTAAFGMATAYAQEPPPPAADPVAWKPCPDAPEADCGSVTVPIDWSKPDGPSIDVAVARRKATDPQSRIGVLLVDPGGPAFAGADIVKGSGFSRTLSAEVRRRFDIVGFDRRGLGGSHPVRCPAVAPPDAPPQPFPTTDEQLGQLTGSFRALAEGCRTSTGPLYDFLDSKSMVRDMDAIRAALGEQTMSHFDVSFGTQLGQEYAQMFPKRVRAMVLDGNMDHSLAATGDYLRSMTKAAQDSFDQYVAWCERSTDCALHGRDARGVFADLYARAERGELFEPGTTEKIDAFRLLSETSGQFYGPYWKALADRQAALAQRPGSEPDTARAPARAVAPPDEPTDEPTDSGDGGLAMTCSNWRLPVRDVAELQAYRTELAALAPDMKISTQGWTTVLTCMGWPSPVRNPQAELRWDGVPPVLVVNSRADPATPYEWAQKVARQPGAVLLTYDGAGHEVATLGSSCINTAVDDYLIHTRTPPAGTHCPAVDPPTGG